MGGNAVPLTQTFNQMKSQAAEAGRSVKGSLENVGVEGLRGERVIHRQLEGMVKDFASAGSGADLLGMAMQRLSMSFEMAMPAMIAVFVVVEAFRLITEAVNKAEERTRQYAEAVKASQEAEGMEAATLDEHRKKLDAMREARDKLAKTAQDNHQDANLDLQVRDLAIRREAWETDKAASAEQEKQLQIMRLRADGHEAEAEHLARRRVLEAELHNAGLHEQAVIFKKIELEDQVYANQKKKAEDAAAAAKKAREDEAEDKQRQALADREAAEKLGATKAAIEKHTREESQKSLQDQLTDVQDEIYTQGIIAANSVGVDKANAELEIEKLKTKELELQNRIQQDGADDQEKAYDLELSIAEDKAKLEEENRKKSESHLRLTADQLRSHPHGGGSSSSSHSLFADGSHDINANHAIRWGAAMHEGMAKKAANSQPISAQEVARLQRDALVRHMASSQKELENLNRKLKKA